jgi:hypothetical protein
MGIASIIKSYVEKYRVKPYAVNQSTIALNNSISISHALQSSDKLTYSLVQNRLFFLVENKSLINVSYFLNYSQN